jgi:peptidoglycan-associated lipoprotein
MRIAKQTLGASALMAAVLMVGCSGNPPPAAGPTAPPPVTTATRAGAPGTTVAEPPPVATTAPLEEETVGSYELDEINRNSPLRPVFFDLDSNEINPAGRLVLDDNAKVLEKNATWIVTIEGHCDERGSTEYNLALGERRALAARAYLVLMGVPAERLRTVSYGSEFPFDPGHDDSAYAKNRRAHFVVTAK